MKTSEEMAKIVSRRVADYKIVSDKKKKLLIKSVSLVSVFLVGFLVVALFNFNSTTPTPQFEGDQAGYPDLSTKTPDVEVYIDLGDDVFYTLDEMIEKSDLIVRGYLYDKREFDDYGYLSTLQSDSYSNNEPVKASEGVEYIKTVSTLHTFKIIEVLKGDAEKSIDVYTDDGDVYMFYDYEFDFLNPFSFYCEPNTKEYILFLKKDEETGYYKLSGQPGAICIIDNDVPYLNSKLKDDSLKVQYSRLIDANSRKNTDLIIKINVLYPTITDTVSKNNLNELINQIKEGGK